MEDALSGLKAAKSAEMRCLGVSTAFSAEELAASGANYVCGDISEVYNVLVRINREGETW